MDTFFAERVHCLELVISNWVYLGSPACRSLSRDALLYLSFPRKAFCSPYGRYIALRDKDLHTGNPWHADLLKRPTQLALFICDLCVLLIFFNFV